MLNPKLLPLGLSPGWEHAKYRGHLWNIQSLSLVSWLWKLCAKSLVCSSPCVEFWELLRLRVVSIHFYTFHCRRLESLEGHRCPRLCFDTLQWNPWSNPLLHWQVNRNCHHPVPSIPCICYFNKWDFHHCLGEASLCCFDGLFVPAGPVCSTVVSFHL